ncbi:FKBP-type peptidyl-prolyl cis-trans isomerase [Cytophagaceae bacterium ABcell3]|nr:FKBP-type peptidyl-prolyl cis-trans isomerase [Cytophagaceae bacterium ABcell3]
MLLRNLVIAGSLSALAMSCNPSSGSKDLSLKTEADSVSYGIGVNLGQNFKNQSLDEINIDILASAIKDVLNEKEMVMTEEEAGALIESYMMARFQKQADGNLEEGVAFLEKNKEREGVVTLESGLQYEIIEEGTGEKPTADDEVTTHYHGTLIDGTVFDSSVERGEPAKFPVSGVIAGWTEALQLMPKGSKWKLYVPADLGYGERGSRAIKPNSTLIFEVELIDIHKKE